MNNFSDLLAIDSVLNVKLQLTPVHQPWAKVMINQQCVWDDQLIKPLAVACQLPLLEPLNVSIELHSKDYAVDNLSAILIEQLTIDNFELIPNWTQLADYVNDHCYQDPTNYLGFNGTWRLSISEPFYQWQHRVGGQGWLLKPQ
jgi:hypothetical protein